MLSPGYQTLRPQDTSASRHSGTLRHRSQDTKNVVRDTSTRLPWSRKSRDTPDTSTQDNSHETQLHRWFGLNFGTVSVPKCLVAEVSGSLSPKVWVKKNPPWGLVAIFPKRLGIFQPNFMCLLCVPIYARVQIFIQLSATLKKLCYIKCDHLVHVMCARCPPSAETHAGIFWHFPQTIRNF